MRTFAQWLKATKGIEMPQGDIDAGWFEEHNLPMIIGCIYCGTRMEIWDAYIDEDDLVYCADCAGVTILDCPTEPERRIEMKPCETLWTESLGEVTNYAIGKAGSRYFFAWSEWRWPKQNEDGDDMVPAGDIEDGLNGIHWFDSLAEAVDDARGTIEVLEDVHPGWAKEALYTLGAMRLTTSEAAHMLGVTEMRIRHLCQAGRMGYKTRWSRDWIIPLRDVERFERRKPGRHPKEPPYERKDEWGGYTVRKSEKGFVVEWWSARQGDITGAKYLVEYGDGYGPETDLGSRHNELMTVGDYIYACTEDLAIARVKVRCLRKGRIVR